MAFTIDEIVPWGRSYTEYINMFNLSDADLRKRILGCGDGPASFNSVLTKQNGYSVSIDPLYIFSSEQIKSRIDETYNIVMSQMYKNQKDYVWGTIASVEELGHIRMLAMTDFLQDYENGKKEGRYLAGELPHLSFKDKEFDMALSSHFLFLYSQHLNEEFHIAALKEMLRISNEVRIFPVVMLNGLVSPYLKTITEILKTWGLHFELKKVKYEFQRGGNIMLLINTA